MWEFDSPSGQIPKLLISDITVKSFNPIIKFVWIKALIVFLAALLFLGYAQFATSYLPGIDSYFHVKYAYLLRQNGIMTDFPWAIFSIWRDHFDDKAFLYHLLLIPFTYGDLALGGKCAAVFFGALSVLSIYLILHLNRIRFPFFWSLFVLSVGHWFLWRIDVARPQQFSVILSLWFVHFLINEKIKPLALMSFIFALGYAILLPIALAFIQSIILLLFYKRFEWKIPLCVVICFLMGMCCSPHFPHNFNAFLFTNGIILFFAGIKTNLLSMGVEFEPLETSELIKTMSSITLTYFLALLLALISPKKHDKQTVCLCIFSHTLLILTFLMKRFIEYSLPFMLLFLASYYSVYFEKINFFNFFKAQRLKAAVIFSFITLVFFSSLAWSYSGLQREFKNEKPILKDAALWLKQNTPENEVIFTCDWDDAPQLFFYNHHNRYLNFLDPTFMYVWNPEIWQEWSDLANGKYGFTDTPKRLRKSFKYGVCTNDFVGLKVIVLRSKEMEIVYQDSEAYIFRLKEEING